MRFTTEPAQKGPDNVLVTYHAHIHRHIENILAGTWTPPPTAEQLGDAQREWAEIQTRMKLLPQHEQDAIMAGIFHTFFELFIMFSLEVETLIIDHACGRR